jgi:hypothetical protein
MARGPDGTFTREAGTLNGADIYKQEFELGVDVNYQSHDAEHLDIAAALTDSLSRSGLGPMLADLDMGGRKLKNTAPSLAVGDVLTWKAPTDWLLNPSSAGDMTISATNVLVQKFIKQGPWCHFEFDFTCTLLGTASNTIQVAAPVARASAGSQVAGGCRIQDASARSGFWWMETNTIAITPADGGVFGLGVGMRISASGSYRVDV